MNYIWDKTKCIVCGEKDFLNEDALCPICNEVAEMQNDMEDV